MEKINIAKLLKDCPKGMELDCTSYDNVSFDKISDDKKATYPIFCYITDKEGNRSGISFTENGCESKRYGAKCVIFPKGKTTWEGFVPPYQFKDGDVVAYDCTDGGTQLYIFKEQNEVNSCCTCYLMLDCCGELDLDKGRYYITRFASEEEKQKLFDAIKANGYKWNAETKTLEKLVKSTFKKGDKVKHKESGIYCTIGDYAEGLKGYHTNIGLCIANKDIDNWELVPNKFDITTLKTFDKVLVRDFDNTSWEVEFFSRLLDGKHFKCLDMTYTQCIPYEHNEHLLGTTNDCDDFYKIWEK